MVKIYKVINATRGENLLFGKGFYLYKVFVEKGIFCHSSLTSRLSYAILFITVKRMFFDIFLPPRWRGKGGSHEKDLCGFDGCGSGAGGVHAVSAGWRVGQVLDRSGRWGRNRSGGE